MSDKIPQFSVVIPTYNRRALLDSALRSVKSQSCRDFEVIIVDDGSADGTADWLRKEHGDCIIITQQNLGPSAARNSGIERAIGRYVVLFDSDDEWFPWTLAVYQEAIRRFRDPAIILGQWVDEEEDAANMHFDGSAVYCEYPDFFAASERPVFWSSNNVAVRRDVFRNGHCFDEGLRVFEDKDLGLRLGEEVGFIKIDQPGMVIYRRTPGSLSVNLSEALKGILCIVSREKIGGYPGGIARERQRRKYICLTARSTSWALLKAGRVVDAWLLFCLTVAWNLVLGRVMYLVSFPLACSWAMIRRSFVKWSK